MSPLTKPLKRELLIQGRPFIVTLSPEGIKLTLKGKRKGQELLWADLVSGEAALAVALNASLRAIPAAGDRSSRAPSSDATAAPAEEPAQPSNSERRGLAKTTPPSRPSNAKAKRARGPGARSSPQSRR
jgi:hypothetical protein